jgi:hypothetical protein
MNKIKKKGGDIISVLGKDMSDTVRNIVVFKKEKKRSKKIMKKIQIN